MSLLYVVAFVSTSLCNKRTVVVVVVVGLDVE